MHSAVQVILRALACAGAGWRRLLSTKHSERAYDRVTLASRCSDIGDRGRPIIPILHSVCEILFLRDPDTQKKEKVYLQHIPQDTRNKGQIEDQPMY